MITDGWFIDLCFAVPTLGLLIACIREHRREQRRDRGGDR